MFVQPKDSEGNKSLGEKTVILFEFHHKTLRQKLRHLVHEEAADSDQSIILNSAYKADLSSVPAGTHDALLAASSQSFCPSSYDGR